MSSSITLVPMTAADLDEFIAEEIVDYADDRVRDGTWARCEALDCARSAMATVVAWERQAVTSESQRLWKAVMPDGARVGWLWVKLAPPDDGPRRAFLCQMTVAHNFRRNGYGTAMLAALEARLLADGIEDLCLNVCEENVSAVRLYSASGFETVARYPTMRKLRKHLGAGRPARQSAAGAERLAG